jgi:2-methylcitrate dehydratase PrpD
MRRPQRGEDVDPAYLATFGDWLACASAGAGERAARAVRALGDDLVSDVAFVGTAGHVLDFDDTFAAGVAHVSAATAPAALVLAAELGLPLRVAVAAYAEGFEAMAAVAAASHPSLYDAGWHPTAVCGPIGAGVAAAKLLELPVQQRDNAVAVALLRAGGTRGAFGSDGKAIQVGLAAAAGVQGALVARAGARVDRRAIDGELGFSGVLGASWPQDALARALQSDRDGARGIDGNWIKLSPSCLGTHSPIEAAARARAAGYRIGEQEFTVAVHPVGRQAAHVEMVTDGLSGKFSIPYCVAYTLIHGAPDVAAFADLDAASVDGSESVSVAIDRSLPEFGSVLSAAGGEVARVPWPRGAPDRPANSDDLADKIASLAGDRLVGALENLDAPAAQVLHAAGLDRADDVKCRHDPHRLAGVRAG